MRWTIWPGETPSFNIADPRRPRYWVFRLRLSVVAVRPVVHLRGTGLQCDRGRHRPLPMGGLPVQRHGGGGSRAAQAHLSILVGLAVLVKGFSYWFDQYALAIERSTGCSPASADNATVTAKMILAIIAGICALLFLPTCCAALDGADYRAGLVAVVGHRAWAGLSRRRAVLQRDPTSRTRNVTTSEPTSRRPERRTPWTRWRSPTTRRRRRPAGQLRADAEALPGIRLIDPNVVGPTPSSCSRSGVTTRSPRSSMWTATPSATGRPTPSWLFEKWTWRSRGRLEQPEDRLHPRLRPRRGVRQPAAVGGEPVDRQGHSADRRDR